MGKAGRRFGMRRGAGRALLTVLNWPLIVTSEWTAVP
jgi:hypothetical protein